MKHNKTKHQISKQQKNTKMSWQNLRIFKCINLEEGKSGKYFSLLQDIPFNNQNMGNKNQTLVSWFANDICVVPVLPKGQVKDL